MKNPLNIGICALLATISVCRAQQTNNAPPPTSWTIVHREANERTWQRTSYSLSPSGKVIPHVQSYEELADGICYRQNGGRWLDSQETINILRDGSACCTNGSHQAFLPVDIASGVIKLVTPEGLQLLTRPIGLSYDDGAHTVLIAELTNSVGELISSNQVLYPNAFVGVDADLLYTYRKSGFEQDLVFRAQPPAPEQFGFNSSNTKLQMLTEFFNPPSPVQSVGQVDPKDGLQDTTLAFGSMKMIQGRAFLTGTTNIQSRLNQSHVYKSWVVADGRNFLIEQLPYQRISQELATLPAGSAVSSAGSILRKVSSKRLLPPARLAQAATNSIHLATADFEEKQGVVLDYVTVDSGETNFTFQGDTMYYVSGSYDLYGTTTFEGGSVIKMDYNGSIEIDEGGSVDCKTGPYDPCVFTSWNDNSIDGAISGSSGSPNFEDVSYFMDLQTTNDVNLHDLRFSYVENAFFQGGPMISGQWLTLRDCQFENAAASVYGYNLALYNVLFGTSANEMAGITNLGWAQVWVEGSGLVAENVTADSGYSFIEDDSDIVPALTNCVITSEPMYTPGISSPTPDSNAVVWLPTVSVPVYQTVGAGNYYLATNSPYRGAGTTNIDPTLLTNLQQKTTWPPVVYDHTDISSLGTLGPQAPRDIGSAPDLGYNYAPLDYLLAGCDLETSLTITAGTAIGYYFDYDPNYIPDSLTLNDGANLAFKGTATQPCIVARTTMVQEGGSPNWFEDSQWTSAAITFHGSGSSSLPFLSVDFTKWSSENFAGYVQDYWAEGAGSFVNCEFYNAGIVTYDMQYLNFTNCLFYRASSSFFDQDYAISFTFDNCTFYNGALFYGRYNCDPFCDSGLSTSFWQIENCSFDGTALDWYDTLGASPTDELMDYNSYNTNNLSWQTYPSSPSYGTNEVVGPDDLMVTNYDWQSGWFGNFYLPSDSPLLYHGSTTANLLGLYHFTTQTNPNSYEGDSIVDIGYHYVAIDQNGNPLDSNDDGIPDYLEDANGNGVVDPGEIGWDIYGDTGLSVIITQPRNGSTLP